MHDMLRRVLDGTTDGALSIEPWAWTVDGERAALEARVVANLRDARTYDNEYHFLFIVRDGLIGHVRAYLDTEVLRAVFR